MPRRSANHPPAAVNKRAAAPRKPCWHLLLVSTDKSLHEKLISTLAHLQPAGRMLNFCSAYSCEEALTIMHDPRQNGQQHISVCLLDTELLQPMRAPDILQAIRKDKRLHAMRLILLGSPQGPEPATDLFLRYDLNDYICCNDANRQTLCSGLIAAIRNHQVLQHLAHNREGIQMMLDCSKSLLQDQRLSTFATTVLKQLARFLHCQPKGMLCLNQSSQIPEAVVLHTQPIRLPCGTYSVLASVGYCRDINDSVRQHDQLEAAIGMSASNGQVQLLENGTLVPLHTPRLQGLIVFQQRAGRELIKDDLQLIELFAQKVAVSMDNLIYHAQMVSAEHAANTDYLTGLSNRRQLIRNGRPIWAAAQRNHTPLALGMVDIDHFKAINDCYGHDLGDEVICIIADTLRQRSRASDLVARYGGEEFIVLAQHTDCEQAQLFFDDLRESIAAADINIQGHQLRLNVSIGVACTLHNNLEAMIKAADQMLYKAKNLGRNRVILEPQLSNRNNQH